VLAPAQVPQLARIGRSIVETINPPRMVLMSVTGLSVRAEHRRSRTGC